MKESRPPRKDLEARELVTKRASVGYVKGESLEASDRWWVIVRLEICHKFLDKSSIKLQ